MLRRDDFRRRLDSHGEDGFSLAEMLVATLVAGLVMAACATMFNAAIRSDSTSRVRIDSINQARVAVESMGRSLRTAVLPSQLDDVGNTDAAFLQGEAKGVSFYANINNLGNAVGPSRVSYTLDASGNLRQTVQPPLPGAVDHDFQYCDPTLASCVKKITMLATGVDLTVPMFTYYDQSGTPISYTNTCPDGNSCLSGLDLGNVDAVDVKVVLRQPTKTPIGPTTYVLRVSLPNHDSITRQETTP